MTPLCDVLRNYAARNPARFHMPGHKGGPLPLPELSAAAALDVTEIPGTGNLYLAGEPFDSAQKPWAERFGFDHCQFLTGGSTMGIHTGLSLLCAPGDQFWWTGTVTGRCSTPWPSWTWSRYTWSGPGWSRRTSSAPSPRSRWRFP